MTSASSSSADVRQHLAQPEGVEIRLVEHLSRVPGRRGEPVTVGVPMPKGVCPDETRVSLVDASGAQLPLQARVLDRWSDRSARWVLLDFQAPELDGVSGSVTLLLGRPGAEWSGPRIVVDRSPNGSTVDTGAVRVALDAAAPLLFSDVAAGSRRPFDAGRSRLRIVTDDGAVCAIAWSSVEVEEEGPLRTAVRALGEAVGAKCRLRVTARIHFYAGSPVVRLLLTIHNPRRARHPGGIWELGDSGSALLKEVSIVLARPEGYSASVLRCSSEPGRPLAEGRQRVEVYQDSSGGENWQSPNHVNRNGEIPVRFRGYRFELDGETSMGLRATPVVVTEGGQATLGVVFPEFWQNFPRSIEADPGGLTLGLFPRQCADLHELQGGEQKTHEVFLLFDRDTVSDVPLDWCRSRLLAHASPEWYAFTEAVPFLTPASQDPHTAYLALVNAAIEGDDTFLHKRERQDEYGWRDFGDIVADHEAVLASDPTRFISHYNNQYDATYGLGVHFLRTGDPRWYRQMAELARHVVDIDIYHTDEDKPAYNRGLFWHTYHYVDAGKSTHRSYPRGEKVYGGGPSNEHDYSTGLMLHHFLTGDPASREAALELARWVIDMDDGRKSVFRWLSRAPTGLASQTGSTTYHGPGRGAANSIATLLNAWTLTDDGSYLAKAEELIRRCIHPRDDIEALNLLDAERRWYYTVFLQSLGKYLHLKADVGQRDDMYAYARHALLHFARWMAEHEYPYLDKPEILEYPNETWAAQDMRKCEVFVYAALHGDDEVERRRFEERAAFFFEYSTSTLVRMGTHRFARPTVLMLVNGFSRSWYEQVAATKESEKQPGSPSVVFPEARAFVPQKAIARRRAVAGALAGAAAGAAGASALLWAILR